MTEKPSTGEQDWPDETITALRSEIAALRAEVERITDRAVRVHLDLEHRHADETAALRQRVAELEAEARDNEYRELYHGFLRDGYEPDDAAHKAKKLADWRAEERATLGGRVDRQ